MVAAQVKVEGMCPLVQAEQLQQFVGQAVVLAGKVASAHDVELALECAPGSNRTVRVIRPQGAPPVSSAYVQVQGVVQPDLSLQELIVVGLGDGLDLNVYNEMIAITTMQEYSPSFG